LYKYNFHELIWTLMLVASLGIANQYSIHTNTGWIWATFYVLYIYPNKIHNHEKPISMGMGMGVIIQNPMDMCMDMRMIFKNGSRCGYGSTRP